MAFQQDICVTIPENIKENDLVKLTQVQYGRKMGYSPPPKMMVSKPL